MFHEATYLKLCNGTTLEVTFADGKVISYDMAQVFDKFPHFTELLDRELFLSAYLDGPYGIVWTDDIDFSVDSIYYGGTLVRTVKPLENPDIGRLLSHTRAERDVTQVELSVRSGIDQSDISRIERGAANPTISTLKRLAAALDMQLVVEMVPDDEDNARHYLDSKYAEELRRIKSFIKDMAEDKTYDVETLQDDLAELYFQF